MTNTKPAVSTHLKWPLRLGLGALGLAVILGGLVVQRTVLMETVVQSWLHSQGFADTKLRVTGLDWHGLQIKDIQIGDELSADAVNVSYEVPQLLSSQIAAIEIVGLGINVPGLVPLDLSGQVEFQGTRAHAELYGAPEQNRPQITVKATFEGDDQRATFDVSALNFTPGGLQPGDIVLALANLGPVTGTFKGDGDVTFSPAGQIWAARLRVSGAGYADNAFNVTDGAGVTTLELGAGETVAHLRVQDGQAHITTKQGQRMRLSDLNVQADVDVATFNLNAQLDTLKVEHPWTEPLHFTGTGARSGDQIDFTLRAQDNLLKATLLNATGRHDLATGDGVGSVQVGPWHFAPQGLQPKQLSPLLSAIEEARGTLSATLKAQWGGKIDGTASLLLDDLTLKTNAFTVEGLKANLNFTHLAPPVMENIQTVAAERIGGVVELQKPSIQFRLDPEGKLYITHGQSGVAGGLMSLDNQVIDFRKTSHPVTVAFSNLDLANVFGLLDVDSVSGTGLLSGSIPLIISADAVVVDNGQIAAAGPGLLHVRSEAARRALGGAGPDAAMLLDVLDDFHYQRLELNIDKNTDSEANIRLSTSGSNPAVMEDQPFVLNINLSTNLDKLLAVLSTALSLSQKALHDTLPSFQ